MRRANLLFRLRARRYFHAYPSRVNLGAGMVAIGPADRAFWAFAVTSRTLFQYWLRPYLLRTLDSVKSVAGFNPPIWSRPRLGA